MRAKKVSLFIDQERRDRGDAEKHNQHELSWASAGFGAGFGHSNAVNGMRIY